MNENELLDAALTVKDGEIKAVVAEIAQAEDGITKHTAGIAGLTRTLVPALYHLGSLLMSLPGAAAGLKKAKGTWRARCMVLCHNKDRIYKARDVLGYFDDPSDHQRPRIGEDRRGTGEGV